MDIGRMLQQLEKRLAAVENSARLSHASIDNTSVEVRDSTGNLRGLLGVQADGTTAVNIVNGPPPPQPSTPILTSVLGGITASWDGTFDGGATLPLDWQRIEVHASAIDGFTPAPETLQGTIETPQGSTVVVVTDTPVYVRLLARTTSGTASTPSGQAGPLGPTQVVADDILDGIVTTVKLAEDAVTAAKIAAGAVGTSELADAAVHAQQLADAAVEVGKLADNAVTGPAIASEAVTAGKLAANSVTAGNIQAGAVTAAKIAAGAITTDKLTVTGGANVLTDPSFEGAYTASIIAGLSYASQDTTKGNGSPTSLKIDATAASATNRAVAVTALPVQPGDQLHIGIDYWAATAWAGTAINIHIRWETAAGGVVSYGIASSGASPVREAWTRLTGTYTAPATAAVARLRIESSGGTAGAVWFDNASMRPVLGGTQIQNGAVTTEKVVAGAIQTAQLDASAVNADKIASGAVTTAKLDALAVTSDKIAANAITAEKILAGSITATALASDAITGKTITGGLIQTATSGERIAINELGQNKAVVYDSTGTAVGEFSARGLRMRGDSGALMILDPDATYPQMALWNAANTNRAILQVFEPTAGEANLEIMSGEFTGNGYSDMRWEAVMGEDYAVIQRFRAIDPSHKTIGGRLYLSPTYANMQFINQDTPAQNTQLFVQANFGELNWGRFRVIPPASSDSAVYVESEAAHTGNLLRLVRSGDKFTVDKDGNTTTPGILSAGNIVTGRLTITPSAANTPTSSIVSGLNIKGSPIRVVATASTTVPGSQVTGVGVTGASSTGFTVWVTRTNTTATVIDWIAIGS